jgi:serine/threonine-protein kinase
VHRDVKPANVMLLPGGDIKLLDFGIARTIGLTVMTRTGDVLGSLQYMAPEQLDGRPAGPAADVYAWAIVLCALLEGCPPERRGLGHVFPAEALQAHGVPQPVIDLLARCMQENAASRPADGAALLEALGSGTVQTPGPYGTER